MHELWMVKKMDQQTRENHQEEYILSAICVIVLFDG
jgi:hypothetical protein